MKYRINIGWTETNHVGNRNAPKGTLLGTIDKQTHASFLIVPNFDEKDRFGYHWWNTKKGCWWYSASYKTLAEAKAKAQIDAAVFA